MNILNVGYKSTNCYLIGPRQPQLLLDAGWPGTLGKLRHQCEICGATLEQIKYVLVTHYHLDHAGLAEELKAFGAQLVVFEVQLSFVNTVEQHIKPADRYTPIRPETNLELQLADSRAWLETLGVRGQVVHTPGHSDDSVSLLLDSGQAFTGDLTPPIVMADDAVVAASWARLRALGARTVYPGHGLSYALEP